MNTYRVRVRCKTELFLDVEADSEAEAWELGEDSDGGDFLEISSDWEIFEVSEVSDG